MNGKNNSTDIPLLKEVVEHTYIVAYKEDTSFLQKALAREGFKATVMRPNYSKKEKNYSAIIRCLINHANVWKECTERTGIILIVEDDFVPVVGLSSLPLPFRESVKNTSFGYLYACGPTLYELFEDRYVRGHAASTAAYLITAPVAKILLAFYKEELSTKDPHRHHGWDTYLRMYVQKRGIRTFLPFRQYGEHGGMPNPEHAEKGLPPHRADVLYGRLHFLPDYARGSKKRFLAIRAYAKLRGIGRLLLGRYLEKPTLRNTKGIKHKLHLCKYGISRLLSIY